MPANNVQQVRPHFPGQARLLGAMVDDPTGSAKPSISTAGEQTDRPTSISSTRLPAGSLAANLLEWTILYALARDHVRGVVPVAERQYAKVS